MPGDPIDFAAIIEQDRTERQKLEWQGPSPVSRAGEAAAAVGRPLPPPHVRHDGRPGVTELDLEADPRAKRVFGDETVKVYNFFKDEFFGMERTLEKIVRYFHRPPWAARRSAPGPLPHGPGRLGQELAGRAAEARPGGPGAVARDRGLPDLRAALHLIPRHLRKAFEDMLGAKIEGDLCPVCRWRLINEHDGKYENVPIRTVASASAPGAASAWSRRSTRTIRTPRS